MRELVRRALPDYRRWLMALGRLPAGARMDLLTWLKRPSQLDLPLLLIDGQIVNEKDEEEIHLAIGLTEVLTHNSYAVFRALCKKMDNGMAGQSNMMTSVALASCIMSFEEPAEVDRALWMADYRNSHGGLLRGEIEVYTAHLKLYAERYPEVAGRVTDLIDTLPNLEEEEGGGKPC